MTPLFEHESLAGLLNEEFFRRKDRNPSYSLRAFARDLELSPSSLSEVLRSQKSVNENTADMIAEKLKLKKKEKAYLKDLVLAESARNAKVRAHAMSRIEAVRKTARYKPLIEDQFKAIAEWYHAAILELIHLQDFQADAKWISNRLGVHLDDVVGALDRLEKMKMIKKVKGTYVAGQPDGYDAVIRRPSAAIRKFQRQVISMSLDSLFEDHGDEREILSMILAVPKSRLPEFRSEMRKFASDFWQRIEGVPKDELYSLSLQLCPVKNRTRR